VLAFGHARVEEASLYVVVDPCVQAEDQPVVRHSRIEVFPGCQILPIGRGQQARERDGLRVSRSRDHGVVAVDGPARAEEPAHQPAELPVVMRTLVPGGADPFGRAEAAVRGLAPVAADQSPVQAVGVQDLGNRGEVGLGPAVPRASGPAPVSAAQHVFVLVPACHRFLGSGHDRAAGAHLRPPPTRAGPAGQRHGRAVLVRAQFEHRVLQGPELYSG
jgi:hypothetical protein